MSCLVSEVWLPWEYGNVRVYAQCAEPFAMHTSDASKEMLLLCCHGAVCKLSGGMSEGMKLLPQHWPRGGLSSVVAKWLWVSCKSVQGIELKPCDALCVCHCVGEEGFRRSSAPDILDVVGPPAIPILIVPEWHVEKEPLYRDDRGEPLA